MSARTAVRLGIGAALGAVMMLAAPGAAFAQAKPAEQEPISAAPEIPAALAPDVAYGRFIALIRADLIIGDELVKQRDWGLARRHFMFPLEEIYGVIREDLRNYKTPPFDGALRALARTVAARNIRQYPKALQKVEAALTAADANLKARHADWRRFVLEVSVATLKTAPDEYEDAVVDRRIVRPIGYQTAWGIIREVVRMVDSVGPELAAKDAAAIHDLRDTLTQVQQGFAPVYPPKTPVLDTDAVADLVAGFDRAAAKLM